MGETAVLHSQCFCCPVRYCVALAAPQRRKRLVNTFRYIQQEDNSFRGDVCAFVHLQEKLWTLFIEVIPKDKVTEVCERRADEGFRLASKVEIVHEVMIEDKFAARMRKNKPAEPTKPVDRGTLDLTPGHAFDFELTGDVTLNPETNPNLHQGLYYHHHLDENYRKLFIEPKLNKDYTNLSGSLKIYAASTACPDNEQQHERECLRSFRIDVTAEEVENYFYEPPPPPLPEPEPMVVQIASTAEHDEPVTPSEPSLQSSSKTSSRPCTASFLRLTTPMKPMRTSRCHMGGAYEHRVNVTWAVYTGRSGRCHVGGTHDDYMVRRNSH